ncbi:MULTISPECIES: D-TA family PLP-dependent enzyme [Arthrobacter]|uniref:D-TA family PLP-dependent enzyme n=2 Tax=Arthrobacter TaxID=1663 RepID=A0ABU9KQ07_9MICC|nr:D-TA family PLP-dependent enzyme [Arthrobacter sp. YJM1]MDP5228661.1 D-TA family PLP-dependent enzyme [Arthrobacter sp. YJM1]
MSLIPQDIDTPATLIDREVLERNIARMATTLGGKGLALRPHVKTHKIPQIAALQLEAGAIGLTVATIGEAEVFAEHGAADIFVAYPLWLSPGKAERLRTLSRSARISFGTDSAEAVREAGRLLGDDAGRLSVLVEIDSGHHRSGVTPEEAVLVADAARDAGFPVAGVFTFPGHSYAPGMPGAVVDQEGVALQRAATLLREAGHDVAVLSGGSTPTALLTGGSVATELRPGVYVFGDAQQLELGRCTLEDVALSVASTVVSRHEGSGEVPRRIVLDAGSKMLGGDRPAWATGFARVLEEDGARVTALSEHHATVIWPEDSPLPALGERLRLIPNHVCVAVNLVDEVTVVSDGAVVDTWAVAARGRNS